MLSVGQHHGRRYTGGAHPYEDFSTFNWNVRAKRTLENTDLFRTDMDWKSAIFALDRQRLQASGAHLSEWTLSSDGMNSLFSDGFVITASGLRFVQHEGATRNDQVPAVDFAGTSLHHGSFQERHVRGCPVTRFD